MKSLKPIIGFVFILFLFAAALLLSNSSTAGSAPIAEPQGSLAQTVLSTFVDLPQGATETYPGSGIYKAPISQGMAAAVDVQTQENWTQYHIAPESNLG